MELEPNFLRPPTYWKTHSVTVLALISENKELEFRPAIERLFKALCITMEDFEVLIFSPPESLRELIEEYPEIRIIDHPQPEQFGACFTDGVKVSSKEYFACVAGDDTLPYRALVDLFGNIAKAEMVVSYPVNSSDWHWLRRAYFSASTLLLNVLFYRNLKFYNGPNIYPTDYLKKYFKSPESIRRSETEILLKGISVGLSHYEVGILLDKSHVNVSQSFVLGNLYHSAITTLHAFWNLRVKRLVSQADAQETALTGPAVAAPTLLNIVITGASSGIGAALAEGLAKDGHRVFICSRSALEKPSDDSLIRPYRCDVTLESDVKAFVDSVEAEIAVKGGTLDVLIHCAGSLGSIGPIEETDSDDWFNTFKVNVFGPYLMVKHMLRLLDRSRLPQIITFSGGGAFNPFPNYSAYAASKSALIRFTESIAAELAPRGIMVNAIAPGFIATPVHQATLKAGASKSGSVQFRKTSIMLKDGRGSTDGVLNCIKALLSPPLRGLTGKTISVNFDPWKTNAFAQSIAKITRSDLYSMRRVNLVNLPQGHLKDQLSNAWNESKK